MSSSQNYGQGYTQGGSQQYSQQNTQSYAQSYSQPRTRAAQKYKNTSSDSPPPKLAHSIPGSSPTPRLLPTPSRLRPDISSHISRHTSRHTTPTILLVPPKPYPFPAANPDGAGPHAVLHREGAGVRAGTAGAPDVKEGHGSVCADDYEAA
ncbi:hypothetical protein MMC30_004941 [Trapelia coarctata]|nr:hypothetical protein [Trapelia coarctata]